MKSKRSNNGAQSARDVKKRADWENYHSKIQSTYVQMFAELKRAPTMVELAARCGMSRSTIWVHCQRLRLQDFMPSARLHADRVIQGLIKAASEGDAAAAKLYFQLVFGWREGMEVQVDHKHYVAFIGHDGRAEVRMVDEQDAAEVEEVEEVISTPQLVARN